MADLVSAGFKLHGSNLDHVQLRGDKLKCRQGFQQLGAGGPMRNPASEALFKKGFIDRGVVVACRGDSVCHRGQVHHIFDVISLVVY